MCWAEKFCLCVPLNFGCVLLGVCNFIFSTSMSIASMIHFASDNKEMALQSSRNHTSPVFNLELKQVSQDIVYGLLLAVALSWMLFSCMLVLGIIRNKSSFILAFFFHGIMLVIFSNLSALLLVIRNCKGCLALGIIIFFVSMFYIHCLVAVYTVYELMQKGRDFRFHKFNSDDEQLLTAEDFN